MISWQAGSIAYDRQVGGSSLFFFSFFLHPERQNNLLRTMTGRREEYPVVAWETTHPVHRQNGAGVKTAKMLEHILCQWIGAVEASSS
jgi:hypothetical protein